MFTDKEQEEIEALCKKSEVVKKLFDFWQSAQVDGKKAMRIALNKKWLDLSVIIDKTNIDIAGDDRVYDSFLKTTKLFEDIEKQTNKKGDKKTAKVSDKSFLDTHADNDRK